MAKVSIINKRINMEVTDIIKYQLITHCYINKIKLNESDLTCLTLLGTLGNYDLTDFCTRAVTDTIFGSTQTVRNCLVKMEKYNLIEKKGTNKKTICLNSILNIKTEGNIILDFKIVHLVTT